MTYVELRGDVMPVEVDECRVRLCMLRMLSTHARDHFRIVRQSSRSRRCIVSTPSLVLA
jgi:hypothetical protein